jgi:hypothetical protein
MPDMKKNSRAHLTKTAAILAGACREPLAVPPVPKTITQDPVGVPPSPHGPGHPRHETRCRAANALIRPIAVARF